MQRKNLAVAGAIASGVLAVGAVVGVLAPVTGASAQTPPPGATPTAKQDRMADHLAKLAANLGIPVDRLKAAQAATASQHIDEAVAAGRLTAEQAAAAKDRIASGEMLFGPGGPGGAGHHGGMRGPGGAGGSGMRGGPGGDGMMTAAAAAIGIDVQTLMTELRAGKSLAQVAEAHGKTRDQLKAALGAQQSKHLDEMLDRVHPPRAPRPAASATPTS